MKLLINQKILMEQLNYVIKGVSSKNLIPILNCIKFDLTSDGLYLLSTDNDLAIKAFIPKSSIEEIIELGEFVVAGKYIYEIIRKLPNTIINIEEVESSKIYISTDASNFNLNCNNVSEFPNISLEENKNPIILSQRIFKNVINQTSFATSSQESRPSLTGINLKISNDKLECVATDSYRLAKKTVTLAKAYDEIVNIIIPNKNLLEVVRMLMNDDNNIELHIFNNKIIFKFENLIVMSRLINDTYPDISKLIPEEFLLNIKVNVNDFYGAIDRASLLTNEFDKNTIKLESKKDQIIISSNIPEIGNVTEKLAVEKDNSEEISIAFSSKYMMDAIKAFNCMELQIQFNGNLKPFIIKNPETDELIQLIVPIRIY